MSVASTGSGLCLKSDWLQIQLPTIHPLGLINLLEWVTGFREHFSYVYHFIIKDITRDTDEPVGRDG
jgi:hypothetical protein